MNNPSFANSQEFLNYSFQTASHLKKSSVSAVRDAMAKAKHFKDSRAYCAALDAQAQQLSKHEVAIKLHPILAEHGLEFAYDYFQHLSLIDFPKEDHVEDYAVAINVNLTTAELTSYATGERGEELADQSNGNTALLAEMVWTELLEWATQTTINAMHDEVAKFFNISNDNKVYQDHIEDHLKNNRDSVSAKASLKMLQSLLQGQGLDEMFEVSITKQV